MVLLRALAAVSAMTFLSAMAGCSSGLSKEDADTRCDQEKASLGAFFDDKVYANCEACFEQCGDTCVRHATSPISYSCDDGSSTTSTSTSTSTTSGTGGASQ